MAETSVQLREDGNELYSQANAENLSLSAKKEKLQEAMMCYERALKSSGSDFHAAASACKNHAKTALCLLALYEDDHCQEKKECYVKAISYFSQAWFYGEKCKDNEWKDNIFVLYGKTIKEALEKYQGLERKERIRIYESFSGVIVDDIYQINLHTEIAKLLLHQALDLMEVEEYNESKIYLERMHKPIEEIKQLEKKQEEKQKNIQNNKTESDVFELEKDMFFNIGQVEAFQAIAKGMFSI